VEVTPQIRLGQALNKMRVKESRSSPVRGSEKRIACAVAFRYFELSLEQGRAGK